MTPPESHPVRLGEIAVARTAKLIAESQQIIECSRSLLREIDLDLSDDRGDFPDTEPDVKGV